MKNKQLSKLNIRMALERNKLKNLLSEIEMSEKESLTINDKILKIKKIKEELLKVSEEIDKIKKLINLLNNYTIN